MLSVFMMNLLIVACDNQRRELRAETENCQAFSAKKTEPLPKRKTGSVFEKCREAQLRLNHKLLHVALAQAQRIENPFLAALKGLILDFDAGIAVVADIGQGGDVLAPCLLYTSPSPRDCS